MAKCPNCGGPIHINDTGGYCPICKQQIPDNDFLSEREVSD